MREIRKRAVDDTWEMFVSGTIVGQLPYRYYLKDNRRSHEKSEESKKRVCAQELWRRMYQRML